MTHESRYATAVGMTTPTHHSGEPLLYLSSQLMWHSLGEKHNILFLATFEGFLRCQDSTGRTKLALLVLFPVGEYISVSMSGMALRSKHAHGHSRTAQSKAYEHHALRTPFTSMAPRSSNNA